MTDYALYEKDEFGDDNTPVREEKRYFFVIMTKIFIIYDIVV